MVESTGRAVFGRMTSARLRPRATTLSPKRGPGVSSCGSELEPMTAGDVTDNSVLCVWGVGAVRNVVGVCGALSSDVKLSDQAARSIG
jgi:hypothetical protein